jgi:hypothetical protein
VENLHPAEVLLEFFRQTEAITAALLSDFEYSLRDQLLDLGVSHSVQTVILFAIVALLVVGAARMLFGLIRVAAVLLLVLFAIHLVVPQG